jgi:hypothetical protein
VVHRGYVIGYFLDVRDRDARHLLAFEQQQIGERRLGALDLRGKHGFLPDVEIDEERRIGKD